MTEYEVNHIIEKLSKEAAFYEESSTGFRKIAICEEDDIYRLEGVSLIIFNTHTVAEAYQELMMEYGLRNTPFRYSSDAYAGIYVYVSEFDDWCAFKDLDSLRNDVLRAVEESGLVI